MKLNERITYTVVIANNSDLSAAQSVLENLADDIIVTKAKTMRDNTPYITGTMPASTYENVFNCKLEGIEKSGKSMRPPFGSRKYTEWVHKTPAQAPQGLEDVFVKAYIQPQRGLCS